MIIISVLQGGGHRLSKRGQNRAWADTAKRTEASAALLEKEALASPPVPYPGRLLAPLPGARQCPVVLECLHLRSLMSPESLSQQPVLRGELVFHSACFVCFFVLFSLPA